MSSSTIPPSAISIGDVLLLYHFIPLQTAIKVYGCVDVSPSVLLLTVDQISAKLSQTTTNGNSSLGYPSAPLLADLLVDDPSPDGVAYGDATAFNKN